MTDQQKVEAFTLINTSRKRLILARMVRQPSVQYHEARHSAQQVVIDKLETTKTGRGCVDPDIEALKKICISSLPEKILRTVPML